MRHANASASQIDVDEVVADELWQPPLDAGSNLAVSTRV
jgi:hypothetical protein